MGVGYTVATGATGFPTQPLAVGITEYVTVPLFAVVALRVCAIVAPLPLDEPVTFVAAAVQLNEVPLMLLGLVIAILVA
jgi:hypothetical protein